MYTLWIFQNERWVGILTLKIKKFCESHRTYANGATAGEEVDHEEVDNLYQEATMPIEAVMAQNVTGENQNNDKPESSESDDIASKGTGN